MLLETICSTILSLAPRIQPGNSFLHIQNFCLGKSGGGEIRTHTQIGSLIVQTAWPQHQVRCVLYWIRCFDKKPLYKIVMSFSKSVPHQLDYTLTSRLWGLETERIQNCGLRLCSQKTFKLWGRLVAVSKLWVSVSAWDFCLFLFLKTLQTVGFKTVGTKQPTLLRPRCTYKDYNVHLSDWRQKMLKLNSYYLQLRLSYFFEKNHQFSLSNKS